MKNIILFVVFVLTIIFVNAQSADEIINQYVQASGGKEKLNAIKSIYLEGGMGNGVNYRSITITKVQGKLSRIDLGKDALGFTIITPNKGWIRRKGMDIKTQEIPKDQLKTMQNQLDIVGPLFNYAAKGYHAAFKGKEVSNGKEADKILLTDAAGNTTNFYIDSQTHLVTQINRMIETDGDTVEIVTIFSDYKEVNGVMFPQKIESTVGDFSFDKIEVNQPVDERLYKPFDIISPSDDSLKKQSNANVKEDSVFTRPEIEASFPDGEPGWARYTASIELKELANAIKDDKYGRCVVRFIVDKDGNVTNAEAITMQGSDLAKFALNAIAKGPKWIPAKQNGIPVKAYSERSFSLSNPNN
ncbi:MAG: energy transducer TonB [Ginsengibacter sp.]